MTTTERLGELERVVAANSTMLREIHLAVVGDGSAGSSQRERLSALEADRASHKSEHRWSAVRSIAVAAATAFGTAIGFKVAVP